MTRRITRVAILGVFLGVSVLSTPAPAGSTTPSGEGTPTPLLSARRVPGLVQSVVTAPTVRDGLAAVEAASPPDTCLDVRVAGRAVYRADEDVPLIPASNQKVLTAWLALDLLGADHRFTTTVSGHLADDGTVRGDLYLVGGGDPVLRTADYQAYFADDAGAHTSLEELADRVVQAGVRRVDGAVVGDESRYDSERSVPEWPDRYLDQHQLGPLSALSVNQGFEAFPEVFSEEAMAELEPTSDPPTFAARTFADLLDERGVRIDGGARAGTRDGHAVEIASIPSPPLHQIIAQLLNRSDNQIAELLVKEAAVTAGSVGSTAAGLESLRAAFATHTTPGDGVITGDVSGVVTRDGSGLSYDNRLTCGILADILSDDGPHGPVAEGLAVAGESGTLAERFVAAPLRGAILAKTGSLNDVTSLSGFAFPDGAPPVVFAYIANGAPVTPDLLEVQEQLGRALLRYGDGVPLQALGPR